MSDQPVQIIDWGTLYRESLVTEVLRSERLRVTILASVFVFSAAVYNVVVAVPGLVDPQIRLRLQAQRPWLVSLHVFVIAYELILRAKIGRWLASRRRPPIALRYLNALIETSIPTALLAIATVMMGARDAFSSPAFLLYFCFIQLSILQLDARLCFFIGLVAAVEHFVFAHATLGMLPPEAEPSFWQQPVFHFNRSLSLFVAGVVAAFLARQIKHQVEMSLRTVQERDRAVRIFGQYVSPQIAEKLLHQPVELAGELRSVCVMFLDIRDFSSFAARARPEAVMEYLNKLFGFMIDVVNAHHGIVNKFLGDGFMAIFGAPIDDADRCSHALGAAQEIIERVEQLNQRGEVHPTRIGIGLHVGEAVTGNVGSRERKEYTVIGDVVNLASRIEQATKEFNARLLISETVRDALGNSALQVEDLGPVELKGQPHPMRIFKAA